MIVATLDTGALIAMERHKPRGMMLLRAAREHRAQLLAITPVVAEWWRGRTDVRDRIKLGVTLVPFPVAAAEAAGLALGQVRDARLAVDAMVMAFAATYGGALVYTSDSGDLQRLSRHSPGGARARGLRRCLTARRHPSESDQVHAATPVFHSAPPQRRDTSCHCLPPLGHRVSHLR